MPEHRPETPTQFRNLESFLWRDFEDASAWTSWLRGRGFDEADAQASFEEAVEVQRALRALEAANNGAPLDPMDVDRLNRAMAEHALRPQIGPAGEIWLAKADPNDAVAAVLMLAVQAMTEHVWRRFKLCREPTCMASYFDASKNGAKTWCSMETCGSRNKMRRYRARQN